MFCRTFITLIVAASLAFAASLCNASSVTSHLVAREGDSVITLVAINGLPTAKRLVNAEENPLKGELWVYLGTDSNQEYLIRDGKVHWAGEVFRQANGTPLPNRRRLSYVLMR